MAGGQPVDIMGYRFTARPLSRWRRIIHDFWPYWQASRPRFILTATNVGEAPTKERAINCIIKYGTGAQTTIKVVLPPLEKGKSMSFEVSGFILGYTGDVLLAIPADLTSDPAEFETVYSFHTTPKSWIFLAIFAGLLAGAFATLGHWLFTLCN